LPFQVGSDTDAQETREWMDALSAVIEAEGPERAHFLLEQLLEHARQKSIDMPFSATTGYVNTIDTEEEEVCPGNIEIEERLRAYMRWNAMAMVVKANRHHPEDDECRSCVEGLERVDRAVNREHQNGLDRTEGDEERSH
jgi:pyruvate dehydrogenase complex dehydrogenase (E1) component